MIGAAWPSHLSALRVAARRAEQTDTHEGGSAAYGMADDVVGWGHTRTVDQGRRIAERMYEAFNRRDAAAAKDIFASSFYSHPLEASGSECVQRAWQRMWDQHPALKVALKDLVADNQRVATRTEMAGFADGSTATMLEMFTFEDDRIVELWGLSAKSHAQP